MIPLVVIAIVGLVDATIEINNKTFTLESLIYGLQRITTDIERLQEIPEHKIIHLCNNIPYNMMQNATKKEILLLPPDLKKHLFEFQFHLFRNKTFRLQSASTVACNSTNPNVFDNNTLQGNVTTTTP
eukprot:135341_1